MSGVDRPRNDPAQYDDLAGEWWRPRGQLAVLHWIAAARARLVPPAARGGATLVDLACGGGTLAPYAAALGYRHVGVDLSDSALRVAREHGVRPVRADVLRLPLADEVADVVAAGEILEHVADLSRVVAEACRVLRSGGLLVVDTIAATWLARFVTVTVGERLPVVGAPPGIHDPQLFVDRARLRRECARHGVPLRLCGLRPSLPDAVAYLAGRRDTVRMVATRPTSVLFQAYGRKASRAGEPRRTPDAAGAGTGTW